MLLNVQISGDKVCLRCFFALKILFICLIITIFTAVIKKKTRAMDIPGFPIRIYGWTELALLYNPELKPESAVKRLRRWVDKNHELRAGLKRTGWQKGSKLLTPLQVKTIVEYLGEP
jgi:hypothetical protein